MRCSSVATLPKVAHSHRKWSTSFEGVASHRFGATAMTCWCESHSFFMLLAALALVGCSGETSPLKVEQKPSIYAVFTGSVHLRGEIRVDGQFTDVITGRGETCAQYANGRVPATTLWVTPTPNNAELVAGHSVSFTAGVAGPAVGFHGPGAYSQPAAQVDVLVIDSTSFLPGDRPTSVITVTSAGSGSMAFSGMADTNSGAAESGTETWTCASASAPAASGNVTSPLIVVPVGAPTLHGTVIITGAYSSSGTFTTRAEVDTAGLTGAPPAGMSCEDYARGTPDASHESRTFVAPEVDTGGANAVYFNTLVTTGYAGPGTYASQSFTALIGTAAITILPASAPQIDTFTSRDDGSSILTVRADGSGVVNIIDWGSSGSDSRISGDVSWTCSASS